MSPYWSYRNFTPWDFNKQPKPFKNPITILRLYFAASATVPGRNWWKPGMSRNLGNYL